MNRLKPFAYLSASPDSELLKDPDIIDEKVHEAEFVTEAHQDVQTGGMKSNAIRLLRKLLVQLQCAGKIVLILRNVYRIHWAI